MGIVIVLIVLLAIWQGSYYLLVDTFEIYKAYAFPSPIGVLEKFVQMMQNGTLMDAIGNSLARGVEGYLIAVMIGAVFGLALNHFKYLQKNLRPIVLGIQTLPSVCWVPFSILWFGLTKQAILFVAIIGSAFSIAISVDNAMQHVAPIYSKVAYTLGANKRQLYFRVIFHASLPELVTGLKQGWSFAWRALMAGEVMTTSIGLGQTLVTGRDLADINQVAMVMVLIIVIGILIDQCIFTTIERRLLKKRGLLPAETQKKKVFFVPFKGTKKKIAYSTKI